MSDSKDEIINLAVERFLGWKLPKDFAPDRGIKFAPNGAPESHSWPVGTNLMTAEQARAMFMHCLSGPEIEITPRDLDMLLFFWREKGDLERLSGWQKMLPSLRKQHPKIVEAWEVYKAAEINLDNSLNEACADNPVTP